MKKLAILGGTFNPIHWGHLLIADTALDQLSLDQVIWVPSSQPPHRNRNTLVDITHRIAMVREAIAAHPAFTLAPIDLEDESKSYAIDTYRNLQATYPSSQWYWIIGLDAFQTLPRWYRYQELTNQCIWLVAPRSCGLVDAASRCQQVAQQITEQGNALRWQLLKMPRVEISSSLIRQYCGDRRSIRYLVPETVYIYIVLHHLYFDSSDQDS